jgi:hypothetical protein
MEHENINLIDCKRTKHEPSFDRRISNRTTKSIIRFEIDGSVHRSLAWNAFGFQMKVPLDLNVEDDDSFIIRGIGYGNLAMIPVLIRAEVIRKDVDFISIRFMQNHRRDRLAFENYITRCKTLITNHAA